MKSKTIISAAVACTFGWAAAAHAGTSHQTSWVAAGDEVYPPMVMSDGKSFAAPESLAADGIYSEYYIVSWTPVEQADAYVIAPEPESEVALSLNDADFTASTYDVILLPGDFAASTYDVIFVPSDMSTRDSNAGLNRGNEEPAG